ncbi:c-type cytochrome [Thermus filiformis]|uniref:Cytochrome Cbb3 n=1 Tax=Thermus filiformis TaxID=276 RepID=A0A0D6X9P3_THEFI|nr:cytochrome c [Thermus filiformis]KIX84490.1 cytochrome Cbb3 [Thermus filiformis]
MRRLWLLLPLLAGCGWMWDQPKVKAFRESPLPVETAEERVALGEVVGPARTGLLEGGGFADLPFVPTQEELVRGKVLYQSYCAVCHGEKGLGDGRVIPLGMPRPRSFQDPALQGVPAGYFYFAATNGFGRMLSYASRIPWRERWLVAAYIKACVQGTCPEEVVRATVY